jgi:hypothetical protein
MLEKIFGAKRLIWSSVKGSATMWSKVWPREVVPAASRAIVEWDVEICWRSGRSRRAAAKWRVWIEKTGVRRAGLVMGWLMRMLYASRFGGMQNAIAAARGGRHRVGAARGRIFGEYPRSNK